MCLIPYAASGAKDQPKPVMQSGQELLRNAIAVLRCCISFCHLYEVSYFVKPS
ncbi:hypothetical protein DPMN_117125 [Dreissena polymorpha]|uniref:Uncharacterized protein n=1 Tax=Dreissena polymorpha TaxID=45954 RepID=A0A9D4KPL5_DREPO|nr:hypothetical protein DPMN_117020 [Dreissena polymorpha]KAH3843603.1 hypothetical protein DPMN_117125 [Dreissena polymorpha]